MEKGEHEVLYETRYHVSRRWSSSYPPQHQKQNEGVKGSILSLISVQGVSQLREKWTGYRRPRKLKKWISLFVSPRGQYVAVALRNHLTILHKDDDYQEPCGIFSTGSLGTFTYGIWSEHHGVLGVVDDTDVVYFLRANGEEITRITKRHLKVSSPIVGLIPNDDSDINRSFLSSFSVIVSDGSLHEVEVSQNPIVSIRSAQESNCNSNLLDFPAIVYSLSYHQELSLLVVVGAGVSAAASSAGSVGACLSLWQRNRNLCLEQVASAKLEGLYSKPDGFLGRLTSPKVLISPEGKFVAVLDLRGSMSIFKLDRELSSLSNIDSGENYDSQEASGMKTRGTESLSDIVDFTWWSDQILVLAKRSGTVTMIDVLRGIQLLEKNPVYSMAILERVGNFSGNLFLLECTLSDSTNEVTASNLQQIDLVIEDQSDQLAPAKLNWSLLSFLKKSVSEMYDILISNHKYQDALDLASCHGLNKDEVLKAQWLHSPQGVNEINMLLSVIKDPNFVLAECLNKVGATEDVARALITHGLYRTDKYRFSKTDVDENNHIWDFRVARLKLLQYRDKLETFLGINMGRFSVHEYSKFRHQPINEAARALAESGKIGALNLLFKRHPYSLSPLMLEVLAAIPETLPVQSYGQLLPGKSSPSNIALRAKDWVECRDMAVFISALPESHESSIHLRTEPILELCLNISWPSCEELAVWYKNRARDIDSLSGQLDNSLSLIDFACRKGIRELEEFREDISYLLQLIYSDGSGDEVNFTMTLVAWERLSDYEKFKMMLKDVQDDNVLERLYVKAIPFMRQRSRMIPSASLIVTTDGHSTAEKVDSFLVRWLKETASCKKLELCLKVIEEGCRDLQSNSIFMDIFEAADCAIQCIYLSRTMDKWSTMASILSRFTEARDFDDNLKRRLKLAEGHVEAGRILSYYQVPKPINFFLDAHSDEKGVKQIIRLILSKFARRQSGHSDNDWASMWRDLQSLREKAFPFLDQEYILVEFCRGLLKAGKFSLARNYLRGTASVDLSMEKAENLVIQAAREYFFSASSLACSEIWKAKECLNLFPNSRSVRTEADIIDALTVKLPKLGVSILPVQFKQINDPMEVIKLAITNQSGVYLNVDELVEVAKLLGLNSKDDICAVQEAIAREAAVAGDLQLASDLCLALAKKGHGPAWDLCAAMARGPGEDNMGIGSRKQLLGFALSYCDEESIGELLHAWKDLDMQDQCEKLVMLTGTDPQDISAHVFSNSYEDFPGNVDIRSYSQQVDGTKCNDREVHIKNIRNIISRVVEDGLKKNNSDWETFLQENGKILSFASLHLPWLLELSSKSEHGKRSEERLISGKSYPSPRTQAMVTILSWLARNDFAPRDDLIANIAKSIMEPPATEEEDLLGSSFLLNLMDAFHGVEVIEELVKTRTGYNEICSIMSVGMIYSSLHNSTEYNGATQRRQMLLQKFQQKYSSFNSDELHNIDTAQSSFWRDWKLKLGEQKRVADHSRVLEQILPGVDVHRFLSRDMDYMENVVFSLIESVKLEKKHILKDVLKLAYTYGLNHTKVLLQYLNSVLVSDVWAPDDITAEMSDFEEDILSCAAEAIEIISLSVYPAIDGYDKQRLAFIYGLLSDCYLQLEATEDPIPKFLPDPLHITVELSRFNKVVEQECRRVSLIKNLNFKNIAGLHGLNLELFSSEVYTHVDEHNVEVLAIMVENLLTLCKDSAPKDLISPNDVYRHLVFSLLNAFKEKAETQTNIETPETLHTLISELEHIYNVCHKFVRAMKHVDILDTLRKFFTIIPLTRFIKVISDDLAWLDCLVFLTNFWLRLVDDVQEFMIQSSPEEKYNLESLLCCLKGFTRVVLDGTISADQGWCTVISYSNHGLAEGFGNTIFLFCRALIVSGCWFQAVAEIYSEAVSHLTGTSLAGEPNRSSGSIPDITHIYLSILENILYDLATGSNNENQNLHHLVSSLSNIDGDLEALKMVRHAVWERIAKFSDDLTLPSHVRVYALELLQFISGSAQTHKGFSVVQQSDVLSWEGWSGVSDPSSTLTSIDTTADDGPPGQRDQSSRLTSSLVALKSSQLVKVISPSIEITSEDLSSVESAVSCFLKLCEIATSETQVNALIAIMEEWEGLFANKKKDEAFSAEAVSANEWTSDDWDEGWESFQEESVVEEPKKDDSFSVNPLHLCWMEIFKKLVSGGRSSDLLKLIDQSIVKSNGTLLDEADTDSLSQIILSSDCFLALKVALLLPYEAIHLQCLDTVEEKVKREGISDTISKDLEFLILVTSSGLVSTIISKPKYDSTFSLLCFMVGSFSRKYQQSEILAEDNEDLGVFVRLVFPCFISELVKADQQILAGFLVTKFMHANASLSLINVAEASLATFLQRQLCGLESSGNLGFDETLRNTVSRLTGKSVSLVQSALSSLKTDVR